MAGVLFLSPSLFFCSLSRASRASPTWLKIDRNYFYACFLRRYLHGRQSCLRSSGPLENLLLQQNGENMLLWGLCSYNNNHTCEVLQIKPMTEGYDDRSLQTIPLKTMYQKKIINVTVLLLSAKGSDRISRTFLSRLQGTTCKRSYFCFFSFFFLLFP